MVSALRFKPAMCVALLFAALAVGLVACGANEEGTGELVVTTYGEEFVEEGFETEDGWTIGFDRFQVAFEDIRLGDIAIDESPTIELAVDSAGEGHRVAAQIVSAGTYEKASYVIARVDIRGTATKGEETKHFDWVFEQKTRYVDCENVTVVEADGQGALELTIHADHLFFDSLVDGDPALVFQALADAGSDENGQITAADLAAADIGAYDPGNEDINDLWSWLLAQVRTLGHIDGEGHCEFEPLP